MRATSARSSSTRRTLWTARQAPTWRVAVQALRAVPAFRACLCRSRSTDDDDDECDAAQLERVGAHIDAFVEQLITSLADPHVSHEHRSVAIDAQLQRMARCALEPPAATPIINGFAARTRA